MQVPYYSTSGYNTASSSSAALEIDEFVVEAAILIENFEQKHFEKRGKWR